MSDIGIRTVLQDEDSDQFNSLQEATFIIKEYQRGYRWDDTQIIALLNDLKEFKTQDGKLKYCLQPLVVKKLLIENFDKFNHVKNLFHAIKIDATNVWELIDGQQRLTTILLILDVCYREGKTLPYNIMYVNDRKIDDYFIKNAKKTIEEWFKSFGLREDDVRDDIRKKIHSNVQFIWYEVDDKANSGEVFTKLNMGKIPLTNAELFKALLLIRRDDHQNSDENRILKISFEWDAIEQSLHDEDFWFFIANIYDEKQTRIDYLLKLYSLSFMSDPKIKNEKIRTTDNLFPFLVLCALIKHKVKNSLDEIWEEIVKIHETLKMWYYDNDIYHKIGFLITVTDQPFEVINKLIAESKEKKKSQLKKFINEKIESIFKNIKIESLSYDIVTHRKHILNVLLCFNIYTMINSKTSNKFSFRQFKDRKQGWNIEHINARANEIELGNANAATRREILEAMINQLQYIEEKNTIEKIRKFIDEKVDNANSAEFVQFYNDINDKYGNFNENGIGNLTLLDEETNKSYKNALFAVKRKKIIERDRGEVFIPVCTKNVFLKMYSDSSGLANMLQWNAVDAECYLSEIKRILGKEACLLCQ